MVLSVKKEKPAPLHHRKRHAQHHKRSKDYDKHYWPYLPLLAIAGLGFGVNILWTPLNGTLLQHDVLGYATSTSAVGLVDETNAQRASNGLPELRANSQLNQAAQAKAEDMVARNYWSHATPDGKQPWWFVTNAGYSYTTVGENLAYGFIASNATVAGWMNSPGHRANILNSNFQDVGIGIANSPDFLASGEQTVVVAMYGKSQAASASLPATAVPQPITASQSVPPAQTATQPLAQPVEAASPAPVATPPAAQPQSAPSVGKTAGSRTSTASDQPQRVVRLETVAASIPAEGTAVTILAVAAAAALFIFRHARALHRRIVHGERFFVSHIALDILLVSTITLGFLLTRTAGFIH